MRIEAINKIDHSLRFVGSSGVQKHNGYLILGSL